LNEPRSIRISLSSAESAKSVVIVLQFFLLGYSCPFVPFVASFSLRLGVSVVKIPANGDLANRR
jgi:hypothetical protein